MVFEKFLRCSPKMFSPSLARLWGEAFRFFLSTNNWISLKVNRNELFSHRSVFWFEEKLFVWGRVDTTCVKKEFFGVLKPARVFWMYLYMCVLTGQFKRKWEKRSPK